MCHRNVNLFLSHQFQAHGSPAVEHGSLRTEQCWWLPASDLVGANQQEGAGGPSLQRVLEPELRVRHSAGVLNERSC